MTVTLKIKRSQTTATPPSLAPGELAYSELSQNLFFGSSGGVLKIGGFSDVSKLAAATANNTADTLVLRDGTGSFAAQNIVANGNVSAVGTLTVDGTSLFKSNAEFQTNVLITGDLAVNGADLTSTATTFNLLNANVTTLNIGGAATAVSIGAVTGITTVNNNLTVNKQLTVTESALFSSSVTIEGDLVVNGTTTTVNSEQTTLTDPVITLASDTTAQDTFDRGVEFGWHNGTTTKNGFFGFDISTEKFTFIPDSSETGGVYTGLAGTIVATRFEGLADRADKLETARTISLAGDITGSVSFDGTQNVTITTTIEPNAVALGTDTTGQYAKTVAVSGVGISINAANADDGTDYTITSNATFEATPLTIVSRDSSGNSKFNSVEAAALSYFKGGLDGLAADGVTKSNLDNFTIDGGSF